MNDYATHQVFNSGSNSYTEARVEEQFVSKKGELGNEATSNSISIPVGVPNLSRAHAGPGRSMISRSFSTTLRGLAENFAVCITSPKIRATLILGLLVNGESMPARLAAGPPLSQDI